MALNVCKMCMLLKKIDSGLGFSKNKISYNSVETCFCLSCAYLM